MKQKQEQKATYEVENEQLNWNICWNKLENFLLVIISGYCYI